MAGGGVSSLSDPMDGAQYTREELEAIVEEAGNWNTYATVHAYTPKAIQHALEAGVRSIEHGSMMDEETAQMIADEILEAMLFAVLLIPRVGNAKSGGETLPA